MHTHNTHKLPSTQPNDLVLESHELASSPPTDVLAARNSVGQTHMAKGKSKFNYQSDHELSFVLSLAPNVLDYYHHCYPYFPDSSSAQETPHVSVEFVRSRVVSASCKEEVQLTLCMLCRSWHAAVLRFSLTDAAFGRAQEKRKRTSWRSLPLLGSGQSIIESIPHGRQPSFISRIGPTVPVSGT